MLSFLLHVIFDKSIDTFQFVNKFICKSLGYSVNLKIEQLLKEQLNQFVKFIESSSLILNNDLKKLSYKIFKNLISIKSYRGLRRLNNLPVRNQRIHTNIKTVKRFLKK